MNVNNNEFVEEQEKAVASESERPVDNDMVGTTQECDKVMITWKPIRIPRLIPIPFPYVRPTGGVQVSVIPQVANPQTLSGKKPTVPRIIHFSADHSGCGFWRYGMLEDFLNYNGKAVVSNLNLMINAADFWNSNFDAVRLQRQSSPIQYEYFKVLRKFFDVNKLKTKMIYEVDDIIIGDKLPDFNKARDAFTKPEIQSACKGIMDLCDEFTVVSPYMRDMYLSFTDNKNITVIPNYATRGWFDGFYNLEKRMKNFDINKKRPRVMLSGGGTHYDMQNPNRYAPNDYKHMLDDIVSTRFDFKYVWLGTYPISLKPFIDNGDMEFHPWVSLLDFPRVIDELGCQVSLAALESNDFNRAKSFIKLQEACYEGIPFVGQNLEPYHGALHKFDAGSEAMDHIRSICKDESVYASECSSHRDKASEYWLDDHYEGILKVYTTPYGDPSRKPFLGTLNKDQFKA